MADLNKIYLNSLIIIFFSVLSIQARSAGQTRWIVQNSDWKKLNTVVKNRHGKVIRKMDHGNAVVIEMPEQAALKLQATLGRRTSVVPDLRIQVNPDTKVTVAKRRGDQLPQEAAWGYKAIQADAANQLNQGKGVKICVVDSGISQSHPDLSKNIRGGKNYVANYDGSINPAAWDDDHGHGTHVSGIIAAQNNRIGVIGVAPRAKLYGMKVISADGWGYLSDVSDAVYECINLGTHIINMSLQAEASPLWDFPLKHAVATAIAAGIKVVAAAGNFGYDYNETIPAGYPGVIVAAASDEFHHIPYWSNYGLKEKDYTAPGDYILSTYLMDSYAWMSGTSMAAPHLVGVTALHLSAQSAGLRGIDMLLPLERQGSGLINAFLSLEGSKVALRAQQP